MKKFIAKHYALILFIAFLSLGSAAVITQINESQVKNLVSDLAGKASKDANNNISANNFLPGFTTTVSSATPIVLTVTSTGVQEITGSTAQTITLPVASTLPVGWPVIVTSSSSAAITIQSSGGNTVATLQNGNTATIWCVLASGTGLASWDRTIGVGSLSGSSGGGVLSTGATMNTLTLTGTTTAATITGSGNFSTSGGTFSNNKAGGTTVNIAGFANANSTSVTSGSQNQYSTSVTWSGRLWNTTSAAQNQVDYYAQVRTVAGAIPTAKWYLAGGVSTTLGTPNAPDLLSVDNSGNFSMLVGGFTPKGTTVSALPTASTSTGMHFYVTDATSPAMGSTVAGGGSANAEVRSNGANWTVCGI